jgi:hypothetical protein
VVDLKNLKHFAEAVTLPQVQLVVHYQASPPADVQEQSIAGHVSMSIILR